MTTELMNTRVRYVGDRAFDLDVVPLPQPRTGRVVIQVLFTGICGSDLHIYDGDLDQRVRPPRIIGHEMVGTIHSIGDHVEGWTVGKRVTCMTAQPCRRCIACVRGDTNVCLNVSILGVESDGSFQQFWEVPAEQLVAVPGDIDLEAAAIIEPLAVAVHDVGRADLEAGDTAVIAGAGPVGMLIGLVLRARGVDVLIADLQPYRLDLASRMNLTSCRPEEVSELLQARGRAAGADAAFEVTGVQAGLDLTLSSLRPRGRMVLVGVHPVRRQFDAAEVLFRELEIVGARMHLRSDYEEAIGLLRQELVDVTPLVTRSYGLEQTAEAFAAFSAGEGVMKLLIDSRQPISSA